MSQTTYDLNNKLSVVSQAKEPFNKWTILDLLNIKLVGYSDPHCSQFFEFHK